jgi:plastocyanin
LVSAAVVATVPARSQAPEAGTVTGHVKLTTRVRSARLPSSAYPTRGIPRHDPPPLPEIRNVVVYVKDAVFHGSLPVSSADVRQENETFVPHVVAVARGSSVNFPNVDPIFHNVFSLSRGATFDLGRYPRGQTRSEKFTKPGLVKVYCRIHSQMSATILVLDHPFFQTPGDDGIFSIAGVPVGSYTLVGWHERIGERTASIRVEAGKATTVELTLPVEDPR